LGSRGARESAIGVASHHHTAAIKPSDIKRSASGARREISSILQYGDSEVPFSVAATSSKERQSQSHTGIIYLPVSLWF
jgi:hypothetical protein